MSTTTALSQLKQQLLDYLNETGQKPTTDGLKTILKELDHNDGMVCDIEEKNMPKDADDAFKIVVCENGTNTSFYFMKKKEEKWTIYEPEAPTSTDKEDW